MTDYATTLTDWTAEIIPGGLVQLTPPDSTSRSIRESPIGGWAAIYRDDEIGRYERLLGAVHALKRAARGESVAAV